MQRNNTSSAEDQQEIDFLRKIAGGGKLKKEIRSFYNRVWKE